MSRNFLKGFFLHQFLQQNISLLNIQALVHQKSGMIRDVAFGGTEILYTHVDEPWTHHFLSVGTHQRFQIFNSYNGGTHQNFL